MFTLLSLLPAQALAQLSLQKDGRIYAGNTAITKVPKSTITAIRSVTTLHGFSTTTFGVASLRLVRLSMRNPEVEHILILPHNTDSPVLWSGQGAVGHHYKQQNGRLVRYQQRAGYEICVTKTNTLRSQTFDKKSQTFIATPIPLPSTQNWQTAQKLTATRTRKKNLGNLWFTVHGASTTTEAVSVDEQTVPRELQDNNLHTHWQAGSQQSNHRGVPPNGVGEFVTLRSPIPLPVSGLRIAHSPHEAMGFVRRAIVEFSTTGTPPNNDQNTFSIRLPQKSRAKDWVIALPRKIVANCVSVQIAATSGAPSLSTAIAELQVLSHPTKTQQQQIAHKIALGDIPFASGLALVQSNPRLLQKALSEMIPVEKAPPSSLQAMSHLVTAQQCRTNLCVDVLAKAFTRNPTRTITDALLATPYGVTVLNKYLRNRDLLGDSWPLAMQLLATSRLSQTSSNKNQHGRPPSTTRNTKTYTRPDTQRLFVDIVRAQVATQSDRPWLRNLLSQWSARSVPLLLQAIDHTEENVSPTNFAKADLLFATSKIAPKHPQLQNYLRGQQHISPPFSLRKQQVAAAVATGDSKLSQAFLAAALDYPSSAERTSLVRTWLRASRFISAEAFQLLQQYPDPLVRALAIQKAPTSSVKQLQQTSEPWPMVRKALLEKTNNDCDRRQWFWNMLSDPEDDIAQLGLRSYVSCVSPFPHKKITKMIEDKRERPILRQTALSLLIRQLHLPTSNKQSPKDLSLASIYWKLNSLSYRDSAARKLRQQLIKAFAKAPRSEENLTILRHVALDAAYPSLQGTAVGVLAELCRERDILQTLAGHKPDDFPSTGSNTQTSSQVTTIAKRALRRWKGRCKKKQ